MKKKTKKVRQHWPSLLKQYQSWEKLFKYQEDYLWGRLRDECDKYFSLFIRKRDADSGWYVYCVDWCGKRVKRDDWDQCNNCHFIGRDCYFYRRDETNCHWGYSYCNAFDKQRHQQWYTVFMVKTYWIDKVDEMRFQEKQPHRDPSMWDLIEIREKYMEKSIKDNGLDKPK